MPVSLSQGGVVSVLVRFREGGVASMPVSLSQGGVVSVPVRFSEVKGVWSVCWSDLVNDASSHIP